VILYLLFCIWKRPVVVRRLLTVAIVLSIGATWIFLAKAQLHPVVGHYVWVAGILIVLSPEVIALFKPRHVSPGGTHRISE
jgi:hypothetical protein